MARRISLLYVTLNVYSVSAYQLWFNFTGVLLCVSLLTNRESPFLSRPFVVASFGEDTTAPPLEWEELQLGGTATELEPLADVESGGQNDESERLFAVGRSGHNIDRVRVIQALGDTSKFDLIHDGICNWIKLHAERIKEAVTETYIMIEHAGEEHHTRLFASLTGVTDAPYVFDIVPCPFIQAEHATNTILPTDVQFEFGQNRVAESFPDVTPLMFHARHT